MADLVGGWFDAPLTEAGHADADLIADRLGQVVPTSPPPGLFSSDLARAARTAEAIAVRLGVEPVLLPGLREKSYGQAEGKPHRWLAERFEPPPAVGQRLDHDEGVAGAETKKVFADRVFAAMEQVLAQPQDHQIVVTHGFALTFVVAWWFRLPVEHRGFMNVAATPGGITSLREDDHFHNRTLVTLNDITHLPR